MAAAKVLVVDDNPTMRKRFVLVLHTAGYEVVDAADGAETLARAEAERPDLILLDLSLPDIDGLELAERLRALPGAAHTPIIAVSGFLSRIDLAQLQQVFEDYLLKPVDPAELVRRVGRLVPPRKEEAPVASRPRVLLVDDSPTQLKLTRLYLEQAGYVVSTAANGAEALALARQAPPAVIVADVLMPELDGFQLCLAVRRDPALAGVPVVLYSAAYIDAEDREFARSLGASAYLTQEIEPAALLEAVAAARRVPPPGREADAATAARYLQRVVRQLEEQAIRNADLARRLAWREAQLAALAGLADALQVAQDAPRTIEQLLEHTLDAIGVSRAIAYLLTPEGRLAPALTVGLPSAILTSLAENRELTAYLAAALADREPVVVAAAAGPDPRAAALLAYLSAESALVLPLSGATGQPVGLLVSVAEDVAAVNGQLLLYRALATHLAQAIEAIQAYANLERSRQWLASVLETVPSAISFIDRAGRVLLRNPAAAALLGQPASRTYGESVGPITSPFTMPDGSPVSEAERLYRRVLTTGQPVFNAERALLSPDGRRAIVSINAAPVRETTGDIIGVVTAITDITDRKHAEEALRETNAQLARALEELQRAQAQLVQQERLRALGAMASGIAHDFNNVLAPLLGYSELLLYRPDLWQDLDRVTEFLELIHTSAQDAASIVSRLREFYREREASQPLQPIAADALLAQVVALTQPRWRDQALAEGREITVLTDVQPTPPVLIDEHDLREALINLVFNAVDALPTGGTITLRARGANGSVVLEVSDTGIGMTEEVRRRCIEPFFTTKSERGTGLGLAMVYGVVQRHGGRLEIESAPGQGTTVRIHLPAVQPTTPTPATAAPPPAQRSLRVLVVDDEPGVRAVLTEYLTGDGHHVTPAANGDEGLALFQAGTFDLVITDLAMPGLTGDRLAAAIKAFSPHTPVVLSTGFGSSLAPSQGRPLAVDAVLPKPATLDALRQVIAAVAGEPRA
jgi:PAS domain S-box-containing protein